MATTHHGNFGTAYLSNRFWTTIAMPQRKVPTCSVLVLETSLTCRRVRDGGRVGRCSRRVRRLRGRRMSVRWVVHLLAGDASVNRMDRDAKVKLARLAAPLRVGAALSFVPWVQANVVDRFRRVGGGGT